MKTIIVLTDFSKTARNAANAAIDIAIQIHSNILLVNSYLLPFAIFAIEAEGRSLVDSALIASVSEAGLKKEARRLRRLIDTKTTTKPQVDVLSSIESVNQTIKNLDESKQISMMIMGIHHTSLPIIFSAIDLEPLLKLLKYPLLIVPKKHCDFPITNFVFATDLDHDDLSILRLIHHYAKLFKFNIHVCHVSRPVFVPDFIEEDQVRKFEHRVAMLGQGHITFTNLKGKNIAKVLNEFNRAIGADILGIIYNPHSLTYKLLNGSHTSQLAKNQKLPLFIFPSNLLENL